MIDLELGIRDGNTSQQNPDNSCYQRWATPVSADSDSRPTSDSDSNWQKNYDSDPDSSCQKIYDSDSGSDSTYFDPDSDSDSDSS